MNQKTIIILVTVLIAACTIAFIVHRTGESTADETVAHYCGANKTNPVFIFRNPTKAFPVITQDYALNVKAGMEALNKLTDSSETGDIDLSVKKEVIEMREKLNQDNIQFENVLKSAFFAFNSHPCDSLVCSMYFSLVKEMAQKVIELQQLKTLPDTIVALQKGVIRADTVKPAIKDISSGGGRQPASIPSLDNLHSTEAESTVKTSLQRFEKRYFQNKN